MKHTGLVLVLVLALALSATGMVNAAQYLSEGTIVSIERISRTAANAQLSADSQIEDISSDGRFVLFGSRAAELTTNGSVPVKGQLYLRDTLLNLVYRISLDEKGQVFEDGYQGACVSADGRYVAVVTKEEFSLVDNNAGWDVYRYDLQEGEWELVSCNTEGDVANADANRGVDMSDNGDNIVFTSAATNLVSGDSDGLSDVFLHSCSLDMTVLVSSSAVGIGANDWCSVPTISGDGNTVAFVSPASNLIPGDTNDASDVFVVRSGSALRCASLAQDGTIGDSSSDSDTLSLTTDGRYLVFTSNAGNLVDVDTNGAARDVFMYDYDTGDNTIVSLDEDGSQLTKSCFCPVICGDGTCVMFSTEEHLVSSDGDPNEEFYLRVLQSGEIIRILCTPDDQQLSGHGYDAVLSADAQQVALTYTAGDMISGDTNGCEDVFMITYASAPGAEPTPTATSAPQVTPIPTLVGLSQAYVPLILH